MKEHQDPDDPWFLPRLPGASPASAAAGADVLFEFGFDGHYELLGVPPHATVEEIKDAKIALDKVYKRLARQGDEAANLRCARLNEAQDALTKPEKRVEYDGRPETVFLSIQDPFKDPALDLASGLELLRLAVTSASDRDPIREAAAAAESVAEPPSPLLQKVLRNGS